MIIREKGKLGADFCSHGWAGGAVRAIQQELGQAGIEVLDSELAFKFVPDKDKIRKCIGFGKIIAERLE